MLLPVACGGSAFEAGGSNPDASPGDSAGPVDGAPADAATDATDASSLEASGSDSSAPVDAGPCLPLTAADTDIYVDSRFTGTPATGAQSCPLHTIQAGLSAAKSLGGPRTVHVAGAVPSLVYDETGPLVIGPDITLLGAGALQTTISASGPCASGATGTCAVLVESGLVDGFTITCPGGDGVWITSPSGVPIVRNVAANGSTGNGIVAFASVTLGPNIDASNNGGSGVESPASATGQLHVVAGINGFNGNKENGIDLSGAATLLFEGGTANNNAQGIRLSSSPPGSHSITGLTAKNNSGPGGLVVYGGQTLELRASTLVGNTASGLLYYYLSGSTLDLGTSSSAGNNVFGGSSQTDHNGVAGVTLCGAPSSQLAAGDSWSSCPPSQSPVVCGAAKTSPYADVAYQSSVAGLNPVMGSCTVGP